MLLPSTDPAESCLKNEDLIDASEMCIYIIDIDNQASSPIPEGNCQYNNLLILHKSKYCDTYDGISELRKQIERKYHIQKV